MNSLLQENEREWLQQVLGLYADLQNLEIPERKGPQESGELAGGLFAAADFARNESLAFDRVAGIVEKIAQKVLAHADWPAELSISPVDGTVVYDPVLDVYRILEAYRILTLRIASFCCDVLSNL